jgi:photosystem II stability/assembly factor-like uncharacterized protein
MSRLQICHDFPFRCGRFAHISLLILFLLAVPKLTAQALWKAIGPAGGDARAFAAVPGQPRHLYLGATNSWLYESADGGASWHRLSKLDSSDDLVLDHIVVDPANPATVYVAAWKVGSPGGGLWVSHDGGRSWSAAGGLRGQSIRAFAQAPSDPRMLFAGTLDGVFRSSDAGVTWTLISPPGSQEIHEVESLAIDPADPDVIYAGTWHLPWKTSDGGKKWQNIKQGIIDDSDVFSILVDPVQPKIVFASACSGIYKSKNAGELFKQIQGIPSTARRTRVLKQDPANRDVLYAGTTEGLYKSVDGGTSFQRMTGPEVIVNDIFIDPQETSRVLLATDRGGVVSSNDAGASFAPSNEGFSARKVEALLVDQENPARPPAVGPTAPAARPPAVGPTAPAARIFAGVVNDKSYGGVFISGDDGAHWQQTSDGLEGRDVFALAESPEGTVLAGTNDGIFALDTGAADAPDPRWLPRSIVQNTLVKTAIETRHGTRVNVEKRVKDQTRAIDGRVYALDLGGDAWLASTSGGLFTSADQGASWQGGPVMSAENYLSVAARGSLLAAARLDGVVLSKDAGQSWMPIGLPQVVTRIHGIAFSADGALWMGAREGVYFTRDLGKSWMWLQRFPLNEVDDLYYDAHLGRVLASSQSSDQVYAIDPKSLEWKWARTGYRIHLARAAGDRLLAASLDDGVLIEPQAAETGTGKN